MNIYAVHGHKVKCVNLSSGWTDNSEMYSKYLTVGNTYTVDFTKVNSSSTEVHLVEVPFKFGFNSCFFEDVVLQSKEVSQTHNDWSRYNY